MKKRKLSKQRHKKCALKVLTLKDEEIHKLKPIIQDENMEYGAKLKANHWYKRLRR